VGQKGRSILSLHSVTTARRQSRSTPLEAAVPPARRLRLLHRSPLLSV